MQTKIFLDTNIVLDMMDSSRANHAKSLKLLEISIMGDIQIFISEDMLSTIYYINSDKNYTLIFFKKLMSKWNIVSFGEKTISDSIEFCMQTESDFEDTLQCYCAKHHNCAIVTSDKKFVDCGVKILCYDDLKHDNTLCYAQD